MEKRGLAQNMKTSLKYRLNVERCQHTFGLIVYTKNIHLHKRSYDRTLKPVNAAKGNIYVFIGEKTALV